MQLIEKKGPECEEGRNGYRVGGEGRGWPVTNTRKDSIEVHCVSITFLLAFEWSRKVLKGLLIGYGFAGC